MHKVDDCVMYRNDKQEAILLRAEERRIHGTCPELRQSGLKVNNVLLQPLQLSLTLQSPYRIGTKIACTSYTAKLFPVDCYFY